MSLASEVLAACRQKGWKLAAAESCTGGLLMAALTDIPGSSDVVDRGFVTYSNAAKQDMLGVAPGVLDQFGAVSEEVAGQMAAGALENSEADLAVSITGVAGPDGGTKDKPLGMVCFGIARRGRPVSTVTHRFGPLGRYSVRKKSVDTALELLLTRARSEVVLGGPGSNGSPRPDKTASQPPAEDVSEVPDAP